MSLRKGKSKAVVRVNTEEMIHSSYPPDQAYAAAKSQQRRSKRKRHTPRKHKMKHRKGGRK